MVSKMTFKKTEYIVYIFMASVAILISIYMFQNGLVFSVKQAQHVIQSIGFWGVFLFIILQIIRVILPFIPGGIVNSMGILLFGSMNGFILNMIGILSGSMLVFIVSRRFSLAISTYLFDDNQINHFQEKIDQSKHTAIGLTAAIALPGFPADLLTYLMGVLTHFSLIKSFIIIFIGRTISLGLYSVGIDTLIDIIQNSL